MTDRRSKARAALMAKFRTVAAERIERLTNALVQLEREPGDAALTALVLREIHTLKGEAKLMGFSEVNLLAHRTEDLLAAAKLRGFSVPQQVSDAIFAGLDLIGAAVHEEAGQATPVDSDAFGRRADAVLAALEQDPAAPEAAADAPPAAPRAARLRQGTAGGELAPVTGGDPQAVSVRVDIERLDALTDLVGDLLRQQQVARGTLEDLTEMEERWRDNLRLRRGDATAGLRRSHGGARAPGASRSPSDDRALFDDFNRLVGKYRDVTFAGEDLLMGLERTVRDLRLLPLSSLFARYPRAVRDLAREQGKQVRLVLSGGEQEVDKQVLDRIGEPLLHLIRNAVDHGIEAPDARRAANKPSEGVVEIRARQAGASVEIAVRDDGRGISLRSIKAAAVERGFVSDPEAELLADEDLMQLIFHAGLTTRGEATDISGRGVGLDVVKEQVEGLGGAVQVRSTEGQETWIGLEVPVDVALMRALVVETSSGCFAIPSQAVVTVMALDAGQIEAAGGGVALRLAEQRVALRHLDELFGGAGGWEEEGGRVVVVQALGRQLALVVPRVIGDRELVQRPLDPFLEELPLLIGMAVLEHAQPTLILNVPELVRSSMHSPGRAPRADGDKAQQQCVLVAEDSELTRDMIEGIVRGMGYLVLEAANGRDALERTNTRRPDLVLTDLEMPLMDGFELIRRIRAIPQLREVPIVVMSSRGAQEDKRKAAELGADAYIVKSDFQEATFREMVARFLGRS